MAGRVAIAAAAHGFRLQDDSGLLRLGDVGVGYHRREVTRDVARAWIREAKGICRQIVGSLLAGMI